MNEENSVSTPASPTLRLACVLLLAAACLASAARSADDGPVLRDILPSQVRTLDPACAGDTCTAAVQGAVYEGLYEYHYLVRPVLLQPRLAEALPDVSDDALTVTIRLRRDVLYQPNACFGLDAAGRPRSRAVRAEDFVLAFKRIADSHLKTHLALAFVEDLIVGIDTFREKTKSHERGDFSRYDRPLEGVYALDEHTLRIKLKRPCPYLPQILAITCYAPVPREAIDYYLATRDEGGPQRAAVPMSLREVEITAPKAAVGTGAYMLHEFDRLGEIVLVRNPNFRQTYPAPPPEDQLSPRQRESVRADQAAGLYADAGKPLPLVPVMHIRVQEESKPAWEDFLAGRVETAAIPQEVWAEVVAPDKTLQPAYADKGIRLTTYSYPAVYYLVFNMEDRVVGKSRSLRQALHLATDVEQYAREMCGGRSKRAVNILPSDFEAHAEAGPGPYARFDLGAAKEKLAEARKELTAAGVIREGEEVPELTLDIGGRYPEDRRLGEFFQQQFARIGIRMKVELNHWPGLMRKVHLKQAQIHSMGWHADYPDPQNFLQLFYSPHTKNEVNTTNYSSREYDRLYEQASVMQPSPKRTELYVKMIRILNEDCPVLLLREPIGYVLTQPWLRNVKPHPIGYGMGKYRGIDEQFRRKSVGR